MVVDFLEKFKYSSFVINKEKNMNNKMKFLTVGLAAFVIGFGVNNYAISDVPSKIAVVDVQKVINSSPQVAALKTEQQAKAKDVVAFLEKARKDVAETTDAKKKQALEEKYNKELKDRKVKIEKDYASKLTAIDSKITSIIATEAKARNYDVVLAKGAVLYGGTDITDAISKAVKANK